MAGIGRIARFGQLAFDRFVCNGPGAGFKDGEQMQAGGPGVGKPVCARHAGMTELESGYYGGDGDEIT